jgi:hypothetical protein
MEAVSNWANAGPASSVMTSAAIAHRFMGSSLQQGMRPSFYCLRVKNV